MAIPEKLEHTAKRAMTRAREKAAITIRDGRADLAEEYSARGIMGGPFYGAVSRLTIEQFRNYASTVSSELIGLAKEVYGTVPAELLPWIRERFREWVEDGARKWVGELEGKARLEEALAAEAIGARRDLEIELGKIELRLELSQLTPKERGTSFAAHVFVCHASEDKDAVARPIAAELSQRGYKVWFDEFELRLGDRLLDKIDRGLAGCRFGVVILSPDFFRKNWPRRELAGLAAREDAEDRKIILPVWHNIEQKEIARLSPTLAAALGVPSSDLRHVITEIEKVLKGE